MSQANGKLYGALLGEAVYRAQHALALVKGVAGAEVSESFRMAAIRHNVEEAVSLLAEVLDGIGKKP